MKKVRVINRVPGSNFVSVYGLKKPTHLAKPKQMPKVILTQVPNVL